jgi:hypothetical protein
MLTRKLVNCSTSTTTYYKEFNMKSTFRDGESRRKGHAIVFCTVSDLFLRNYLLSKLADTIERSHEGEKKRENQPVEGIHGLVALGTESFLNVQGPAEGTTQSSAFVAHYHV